MVYVQGRPLDLGLEGEDDLSHCEGELPCDHNNFVLLLYSTYGNNLNTSKVHSYIMLVWRLINVCDITFS